MKNKQLSRTTVLLLCLFLGGLGIHRFYVGKIGSGVAMLLMSILSPFTLFISLFAVGIWATIDLIMIIVGTFKDGEGNNIVEW
jgi:TM2 domain-containing membrane protein YozV